MAGYNKHWDEIEEKTGFTYGQIEWYHATGKMPDWVYYQVNGKDPNLNLYEQTQKFKQRAIDRMYSDDTEKYTINIKSNVGVKK